MRVNDKIRAAAAAYIAGRIGLRGKEVGHCADRVYIYHPDKQTSIHVKVVSNLWNPDSNWNPVFDKDIFTDYVALVNNSNEPEVWIFPTSTLKAHFKGTEQPYLPRKLLDVHLRRYKDNWSLRC